MNRDSSKIIILFSPQFFERNRGSQLLRNRTTPISHRSGKWSKKRKEAAEPKVSERASRMHAGEGNREREGVVARADSHSLPAVDICCRVSDCRPGNNLLYESNLLPDFPFSKLPARQQIAIQK